MSSYVVTGASRGIGLEFVRQLSKTPENQVFALVRNKASADRLAALEGRNVYVFQADVTDHKALKSAAAKVANVTGGQLDVLINNAAAIAGENDWRNLTDFDGEEDLLEQEFDNTFKVNVVGVIHATNAFLPLLRKGTSKKVVTINTYGSDCDFVYKTNLTAMVAYGSSKAAAKMIVTKYAAQLKDEGFVFVAMSPGYVDVSETVVGKPSKKNADWILGFTESLKKAFPNHQGMISPAQSVAGQLHAIAKLTYKDNGTFIGNTAISNHTGPGTI